MIHDVWISGDPNFDIMPWRIQGYAYLSEWHKDFLKQHHKMPEDKMFLTANGIDQTLYADVDTYEKKNQTVYSSSLDRGLYQFLMMLPEIRKSVPDFKVIVCYGLLNWEESIKARNDVQSLELLNKIKALMEQPGVEYRGRVSKKVLSGLQKESKVFLFPSWFQETFCCTSVEAGLSKNPILSTDLAGLKTTVGSAGILLPYEGLSRDVDYPESYKSRFIEEAVRLLKDEDYRREWADKAYNKMQAYSWGKVAEGWIEQFKK
jgi:glycosyltransferase involved in cell wall biosynthesis